MSMEVVAIMIAVAVFAIFLAYMARKQGVGSNYFAGPPQ